MRILCFALGAWLCCTTGAVQAGKIYWAEFETKAIRCADLDGSDIETVVAMKGGGPYNVALDPVRRKVYWTTTEDVSGDCHDTLWRADLDGNQVEVVAQEPGCSAFGLADGDQCDVAIDASRGRIYWSRGLILCDFVWLFPVVLVADVDQGVFRDLYFPFAKRSGIVVGPYSHRIFWADEGGFGFACQSSAKLQFGFPEGDFVEDILVGAAASLESPTGIAVNELTGDVYWTDSDLGAVVRSRLDGSMPPETIATATMPVDIAVDLETGAVFWSDSTTGHIARSNADGSDAQTIIDVGSSGLNGIAILARAVPIPAASTWGLVIVALALVVAGTVIIRHRLDAA